MSDHLKEVVWSFNATRHADSDVERGGGTSAFSALTGRRGQHRPHKFIRKLINNLDQLYIFV
jgi:hypothetical protein